MKRPEDKFFVVAMWDEEGKVWYVAETNVPGLHVEAENPAEMISELQTLVPEMLTANGVRHGAPKFPFDVTLAHLEGEAASR